MTIRDWLLLFLLSILFGGSFFFVAVAVHEVPPFTLVACRVCLAALILLPALRLVGMPLPAQSGIWRDFLIMGLLSNAIPFSLIVWGQSQIPSGLASILNATTPISTVLVAHIFTVDEKLTPPRIVGVLIGLGGVVTMLGADLLTGLGSNFPAQASVLLATVSYAFGAVYGRRFRRLGIAPAAVATGQLVCAGLVLLPIALLVDRPWQLALPSMPAISAILALAAFSTAFAYVIFSRVIASAGSNANLVTLLVPVTAILLGALVLGERLEPRHFIGIGAIALGLAAIDGRLLRLLRR